MIEQERTFTVMSREAFGEAVRAALRSCTMALYSALSDRSMTSKPILAAASMSVPERL